MPTPSPERPTVSSAAAVREMTAASPAPPARSVPLRSPLQLPPSSPRRTPPSRPVVPSARFPRPQPPLRCRASPRGTGGSSAPSAPAALHRRSSSPSSAGAPGTSQPRRAAPRPGGHLPGGPLAAEPGLPLPRQGPPRRPPPRPPARPEGNAPARSWRCGCLPRLQGSEWRRGLWKSCVLTGLKAGYRGAEGREGEKTTTQNCLHEFPSARPASEISPIRAVRGGSQLTFPHHFTVTFGRQARWSAQTRN